MNFIYKSLFTLPNLRPYTKHKKRIIPAIITGRISSFFLLLYYIHQVHSAGLTVDPPTKSCIKSWGGPLESSESGPPRPPSGCALAMFTALVSEAHVIVLLQPLVDEQHTIEGDCLQDYLSLFDEVINIIINSQMQEPLYSQMS